MCWSLSITMTPNPERRHISRPRYRSGPPLVEPGPSAIADPEPGIAQQTQPRHSSRRPRDSAKRSSEMLMTTDTLHGRTALVTGGSRGIGAAIVRSLAQAGAAVAVNYRERSGEA